MCVCVCERGTERETFLPIFDVSCYGNNFSKRGEGHSIRFFMMIAVVISATSVINVIISHLMLLISLVLLHVSPSFTY